MKYYLESSSEVFGEVKSTENGLTSEQARRRSAETGKNKLAEGKKTPLILRFLSQFADPMIIILIAEMCIRDRLYVSALLFTISDCIL